MKVLIVEDDESVARLVYDVLLSEGFEADIASTGEEALAVVATGSYDLLILDIELPSVDGFAVIGQLRAQDDQLPVLMLTGRDTNEDVIRGLEAGADDYLTKPFDVGVLLARVEALARRADRAPQPTLRFADVELDQLRRTVARGTSTFGLTPKEFEVLRLLMLQPDRVVSRKRLLSHVWKLDFDPRTNVVEVTISRIRKKLESGGHSRVLVREGDGYRLRDTR